MELSQFKLRSVAKEAQNLSATPDILYDDLNLPKDSLVHFMADGMGDLGIRGSHPIIRNWKNAIRHTHIIEGYGERGKMRRKGGSPKTLSQNYLKSQKRFARINDVERAMTKPNDLIVFDYSLYKRMFTMPENIRIFIYAWENLAQAYLENIKRASSRVQFLHVKLPEVVPAHTDFKKVLDDIPSSYLDEWRGYDLLWLLEVWRGIRGKGILQELREVPNLYLTVTSDNTCQFFDLGRLLKTEEGDAVKVGTQFVNRLQWMIEQRTDVDTEALKAEVSDEEMEEAPDDTLPPAIKSKMVELTRVGKLSSAERKRLTVMYQRSIEQPSPFNAQSLKEFAVVPTEERVVKDEVPNAVNKRMLPEHAFKSSIRNWDRAYLAGPKERHFAAALMMLNDAGYLATDFEVEDRVDALNDYRDYTFKITPVEGLPGKIRLPIPNMDENGVFKTNGTRYTMDTQRVDVPIRKVSDTRAALTAYPGKIFIQRSELAKNSYRRWIVKQINKIALDVDDKRIIEAQFGGSVIPESPKLPIPYTSLMTTVTKYKAGGRLFYFNYANRASLGDEVEVKAREKKGHVVCGKDKHGLMTMDMRGNVYTYPDGKMEFLAHFNETVPNLGKPPKDVAVVGIFGKYMPVGIVLAYYLGLTGALKKTKTKFTKIAASEKYAPEDNEIVVTFEDYKLVIKLESYADQLMYAGFDNIVSQTSGYRLADMELPENVADLLGPYGAARHHLIEIGLQRDMFIDPVTKELLEEMKEPTDLIGLYIRCVELITTDGAPAENHTHYQRFRRGERVNGFVFKSLYDAVREQRGSLNPGNTRINLKPKTVWQAMESDSTTQLVGDANPIHNLKEMEAISLAGEGGRTARTLVKRNRAYNRNDLGVISEAGPDSAKTGIRSFTPPNPKINNIYGMAGVWEPSDGATSVLSTTGLTLPGIPHDDGKRQVLASVQQTAVVAAVGYQALPLQTGYEKMIASRTSNTYAYTPDLDGEVTKVTKTHMSIKLSDDTDVVVELGTVHGTNAGSYIPHEIVTDMKKGDKFKAGDVIAWNKGFFERDLFSKSNASFMTGALAYVCFVEDDDTLEDGDAISAGFTPKLQTKTTKRKTFLFNTEQGLADLVKVGQEVSYTTPLMTIFAQEAEGLIDDATLEMLRGLSDKSPKAGVEGVVTRIEVIYMGNPGKFSPSVMEVIEQDNKRRDELYKANGRRGPQTGQIFESTYVGGELVVDGTVAISIYIDHDLSFGTGDKLVVCNQLKSVGGRVMDSRIRTRENRPIDLKFSYASQNDRIVDSATIQGTVNTVSVYVHEDMVDAYFNR